MAVFRHCGEVVLLASSVLRGFIAPVVRGVVPTIRSAAETKRKICQARLINLTHGDVENVAKSADAAGISAWSINAVNLRGNNCYGTLIRLLTTFMLAHSGYYRERITTAVLSVCMFFFFSKALFQSTFPNHSHMMWFCPNSKFLMPISLRFQIK